MPTVAAVVVIVLSTSANRRYVPEAGKSRSPGPTSTGWTMIT